MVPDEYLDAAEIRTLKAQLESQLEAILAQSRDAVREVTEVRSTEADPLDLAVSESNRAFTLRLADRERRLLGKIRHALDRMQEGQYGTCESCGDAISLGRLMARPVATQCIDCKTEAEQVEHRRQAF